MEKTPQLIIKKMPKGKLSQLAAGVAGASLLFGAAKAEVQQVNFTPNNQDAQPAELTVEGLQARIASLTAEKNTLHCDTKKGMAKLKCRGKVRGLESQIRLAEKQQEGAELTQEGEKLDEANAQEDLKTAQEEAGLKSAEKEAADWEATAKAALDRLKKVN